MGFRDSDARNTQWFRQAQPGAAIRITVLATALMILAWSAVAPAQTPPGTEHLFTLDQLLEVALRENPDLRAAQQSWEAAKARIPQAKALDDPQIGMMFNQVPQGNTNPLEPNNSLYRLQQMIPFPGKRSLRGQVAEKGADQASALYKAKERELISNVKVAYYDLYLAEKAIQINNENVQLARYFVKVAETRYATGQTSQQDVLKAQVELSRLLNEEITLQQELETARARLNILLNRPPQVALEIPRESAVQPFTDTLEQLQELALETRPELQAVNSFIEQSQASLSLAKKNYLPDFMAQVERMPGQKGSGAWDVMLMVNIPLFFRDKYDYAVKEAEASIQASKATYESTRNQVLFEIKDLLVKVQTAERLENLLRTTIIPQAEQSLRAAEAGYQAGRIDFLSLIDAQRALQDFRLDYYRSITNFSQQRALLERAVGTTLK
ncbi:TolC family protein [Candidatus Poribacteria bacterium]|nr:TolC family protein [Candidatus Poribacteria bacterium]